MLNLESRVMYWISHRRQLRLQPPLPSLTELSTKVRIQFFRPQ
jgi:hypothetical protein